MFWSKSRVEGRPAALRGTVNTSRFHNWSTIVLTSEIKSSVLLQRVHSDVNFLCVCAHVCVHGWNMCVQRYCCLLSAYSSLYNAELKWFQRILCMSVTQTGPASQPPSPALIGLLWQLRAPVFVWAPIFLELPNGSFSEQNEQGKARDLIHSVDALCQSLSRPFGPTSIWNNRASIHLAVIDQFWLAFLMAREQKGLQGVRGANLFFFHHVRAFLYD